MYTVNGFDIPLRNLTEEEATRDITWERFREFHYTAGEDFLDTTGEGNRLIFGGFLLARYPTYADEILKVCNDKYGCSADYLEIIGFDNDKDIDTVYLDFAEFANLTSALKKRINQVLIQVVEHYSPKGTTK